MSNLLQLIILLITIESGGNDYAIGKDGELGCLQIKKCVVMDVNEWWGTSYQHTEMFNRAKSVAVFRLYMARWIPWYERKTGRKATDSVIKNIWQRGPINSCPGVGMADKTDLKSVGEIRVGSTPTLGNTLD